MTYAADVARSVVRYGPDDREALRAFQRAHFGSGSRQCDERFFDWLYERNPCRDPAGPALWLCKRDGAVVGQQGAIPVTLKIGAEERRAAWGIDLMVHPRWRLRGVAPALLAAYQRSTEVCLGLGLSDISQRTFERRGWTDMGRLQVFVRPLDPQACAQSSQAPKLLAKAAPRVLVDGSARFAAALLSAAKRATLEPVRGFDERLDALWAEASRDYPVLVKRDFAAVRWRFDETPNRDCYERFYLRHRSRVVGYAVLRYDRFRDLTVARLTDYLAPVRWLSPLIASVIAEASAREVAAVFIEQLHARAERIMKLLGCWPILRSTHFVLHPGTQSDHTGPLQDCASWFVTFGDSDCDHLPRESEAEPELTASFGSHPQVIPPAAQDPAA